jgi:hypothetical protein
VPVARKADVRLPCQQRKSGFARAGEAYLSVGENVRTDLIYAGLKLRDRERLFEKGSGPGSRRMDS